MVEGLARIRAPPVIAQRTWDNYRYAVADFERRIGGRTLVSIDAATLLDLRAELEREGKRPHKEGGRSGGLRSRTVMSRLGVLRLILRDARVRGLISSTAFDVPLPRRRTKRSATSQIARRVTFRPFQAEELEALVATLRAPRNDAERAYYPLTEALLLTGLRWGEAGGWLWTDVSRAGGRVHVQRALVRGQDDPDEPTKTGATWSIPLREPLASLLAGQRARTFLGRPEGRASFSRPKAAPSSTRSGASTAG